MIKIKNLSKSFRTEEIETIALNGVSMEVKKGEFVAIMGPSGCGKSTLLHILGLLDNPDEGSYLLDGEEMGHLKEKDRTRYRKGRIGFVFQSFNLIDELTVEENIDLQLKYLGVPKAERKQQVLDILRKVRLSQRAKHYPQQLSGGQQQRVAIARAVVGKPKLILADEPTGNLDSKNSLEIMKLLSQLNAEGTTIVMVTHSQHDATYADYIINLLTDKLSMSWMEYFDAYNILSMSYRIIPQFRLLSATNGRTCRFIPGLPTIIMNSVLYPNFFLFTDMCVFGRITDSKITGKLISIGGFNQLFYMFRFVADGNTESTCQSFCRCCQQHISTAAHAEAK